MTDPRAALLTLLLAPALAGCFLVGEAPEEPTLSAVQALDAVALQRLESGDLAGAQASFEQALAEAERLDDLVGQAETWNGLAMLESARCARVHPGEEQTPEAGLQRALSCCRRALRLHREAGNQRGIARTQQNLGAIQLELGEHEAARASLQAALRGWQQLEDPRGLAGARIAMAALSSARGDLQGALGLLAQAEGDARLLGERDLLAAALANRGIAQERGGRVEAARASFEEALRIDRRRGSPPAIALDLAALARLSQTLGDAAAAARYHLREALVRRRSGDARGALAALARAAAEARRSTPPLEEILAEVARVQSQIRAGLTQPPGESDA